jgi:hypothetical protein
MRRILALSLLVATLSLPAFSAGTVDPATVTCKEYNTNTHQGMMDIGAAMHNALTDDAKLGALDERGMIAALDKACEAHPDATVMDALHS